MRRALGLSVVLAFCCGAAGADEAGFRALFDGRSTDGWTTLERKNGEGRWMVEDGALVPTGKPGDLISEEAFGDFDLRFEWKIAALGNSGVFYRVDARQGAARGAIEYQLADNARKPSIENPDRRNGSVYGLYSQSEDASKPVGEWSTSRIVARDRHVEHWLNGVRVASFVIGSAEWRKRLAKSKFAGIEKFGAAGRGRIVLQSHGDRGVAFRRIRVRTF